MNQTFNARSPEYNACVGNNGGSDFKTYYDGYNEAVETLLKATLKHKTTLDIIVYPIVYSARHWIELFLKHHLQLIAHIYKAYNSDFSYSMLSTHEISVLWKNFKKLASVDPRYSELVSKIDSHLSEYIEVDDNGEAFRYPIANNNKKYLTDLHCINLQDFAIRFSQLKKLFNNLECLNEFLWEEYNQKSVAGNLSRDRVKIIAKELPQISEWSNKKFSDIKKKIINRHNISSNTLSKVISLIKLHREFSMMIGVEIPFDNLNGKQVKWFFDKYQKFLSEIKGSVYSITLDKYIRLISKKMNLKAVASLAQLYDIGYFGLYSEEFDEGYAYKLKKSKCDLIRYYLLGNGIVKERILWGLRTTGQNSIIENVG